jgi:Tfp pilus assembly protein PilF
MIAKAFQCAENTMARTRTLLLVIVLPTAVTAWAAQQKQPPPAGHAQSDQQENATPSPVSAEKDIQVGTFYMHKGDTDAAIPRFEDAIRQQPKLARPRILLAEAYEKKGDKIGAVKYYREYLQVFPHAPDATKVEKKIEKLTSR